MKWYMLPAALITLSAGLAPAPRAGELTLELKGAEGVTFVGALARWDEDGNAVKPVNPKAKIDAPEVTAQAQPEGNRWVFPRLSPGRYDLVILARDRVRVEGFGYPPVLEFDPFLSADAKVSEEFSEPILKKIRQDPHYENKVSALYMAGNEKSVRVLMQLVRDKATSYDGDFGAPVATVRHEVWQYTNKRGTWSKEKRTRVLDRVLMARGEFHKWTWVWDPALGDIKVQSGPVKVTYEWPGKFTPENSRGWLPQ